MKGLFIPGITAEMFRNGCLESIEALMAEGEIYDIEYEPKQQWIPVSEGLPEEDGTYIVSGVWESGKKQVGECNFQVDDGYFEASWNFEVKAWMPLPEPMKAGE